jgi:hypothetical protein
LTLETVLLAVTATLAMIGAALIAVPSTGDATSVCLDFSKCLSF